MKGPRPPLSLCIGALLVAGSPRSDGQTSPVPPLIDSSTKIPINSPDDRFFLSIEAVDPKFDSQQTKHFLENLGGKHVEIVED